MVFVHQGTADQGPPARNQLHPRHLAVADPDGALYRAVAVGRGGWREMFGLRAWHRGIAAFRRGHRIGRRVGDPWTLPTTVALRGTELVWEYRGTHAGDHPDLQTLSRHLAELT